MNMFCIVGITKRSLNSLINNLCLIFWYGLLSKSRLKQFGSIQTINCIFRVRRLLSCTTRNTRPQNGFYRDECCITFLDPAFFLTVKCFFVLFCLIIFFRFLNMTPNFLKNIESIIKKGVAYFKFMYRLQIIYF